MRRRTLSRVRPRRWAISEAVTRSSGSMRRTRGPRTLSTLRMAEPMASLSVGASRSNSAYATPSTEPKVASSQPASNSSSICASGSPSRIRVKWCSAIQVPLLVASPRAVRTCVDRPANRLPVAVHLDQPDRQGTSAWIIPRSRNVPRGSCGEGNRSEWSRTPGPAGNPPIPDPIIPAWRTA